VNASWFVRAGHNDTPLTVANKLSATFYATDECFIDTITSDLAWVHLNEVAIKWLRQRVAA
jgi:hypothetical protein